MVHEHNFSWFIALENVANQTLLPTHHPFPLNDKADLSHIGTYSSL